MLSFGIAAAWKTRSINNILQAVNVSNGLCQVPRSSKFLTVARYLKDCNLLEIEEVGAATAEPRKPAPKMVEAVNFILKTLG